jgi:hypothetical protein
MPVKRKRRVGLIVGIVIAILAIVIVGGAVLASKSSPTTAKGPSGNTIDSTASSIITNIQMASAIDTNSYQPTTLATSFQTSTDIYATFQFDFRNTNVSQQNPGYVQAKYYAQNKLAFASNILKADDSTGPNGYGYFNAQYYRATTDGAVELYWCRKPGCSDAKLAQTAKFTVS